ncbi:hypothetical protein [Lentzea sp. NPDC055074]
MKLTASERLDEILWHENLRGFPPFGAQADQPMVCLSESPPEHLRWLLNQGWAPWGVLFTRQSVYDIEGGSVWYARSAQHDELQRAQLPWAVRFETAPGNRSDWLAEREWRIPVLPELPGLNLDVVRVAALLIGEPDWQPSVRQIRVQTGGFVDMSTGQPTYFDGSNPYLVPEEREILALPRLWQSTPRWYWDATAEDFIQTP